MIKPTEMQIGQHFKRHTGTWRCTDIGTRSVMAIRVSSADGEPMYSESALKGPPYKVPEFMFRDDDLQNCYTLDDPDCPFAVTVNVSGLPR